MRLVGSDTLLGKWDASMLEAGVIGGLADLVQLPPESLTIYFVLKRALTGAARGGR